MTFAIFSDLHHDVIPDGNRRIDGLMAIIKTFTKLYLTNKHIEWSFNRSKDTFFVY